MRNDGQLNVDGGDASVRRIASRVREIRTSPVQSLPIGSLQWSDSPRVLGENDAHVRVLAEVESTLPPIIVQQGTMAVIDGAHRVRAALLRGRKSIPAYFFEGTEEEAFLLSVSVNTMNGLPLSAADRVNAARRILHSYPQWSDRAIATIAGMSAGAVAELRRKSITAAESPSVRIGRDGRSRPLSSASGRERASELIKSNPNASLRQIAAEAGISPATVADVRNRLRRGADPIPSSQRAAMAQGTRAAKPAPKAPTGERKSLAELAEILGKLRRDPSLRFNQTGREVLHLLSVFTTTAQQRQRILSTVPEHCRAALADLMHGYADILKLFGDELDQATARSARQTAI